MSIVLSETISSITQKDGRTSIVERHVAHTGESWILSYKGPVGSKSSSLLAGNAVKANQMFVMKETESFVSRAFGGEDMSGVIPDHITIDVAIRAIISAFIGLASISAVPMVRTIKALSDDQINKNFPQKLAKIKRRITRLASIKIDVDMDSLDVEKS